MIRIILTVGPVLAMLSYPIYVLLMAAVLRIVGVERKEIAKWALHQADRKRLVELIRAVRGSPESFTGNVLPGSSAEISEPRA